MKKKRSKAGWKKQKSVFVYYFKASVAKRFNIKKIDFIGFEARPVGLSLYQTGGGFNRNQSNKIGGDFVLGFLNSRYKKQIKLYIYRNEKTQAFFKVLKKAVSIRLSFKNFFEILKDLGDEIKKEKELVIEKRLALFFPHEFTKVYSEEKINSKLNDINLNNLKTPDHEAVASFIKKYISLNADNDKILENLQTNLVIQGKKKSLDQVIKKFERHLKNKNFDEKKWQKFLHKEVFFFISNYVESIREADVNFGRTEKGEKKPDFVWIDLYGFLDVFEIKTPYTDVLARRIDKSHKNYYFSTEATKAISQIEKYILFLEANVDNFENYLSKKTKIPFSVLKPKAFLIIGNSKEFENNADKKKDFRLLRRLFKNIEFITFDELLDNLRNLANKFDKESK